MGEEYNNMTFIFKDVNNNEVIGEFNGTINEIEISKDNIPSESFCSIYNTYRKDLNFEIKCKISKLALKTLLGDKYYNTLQYNKRMKRTNELYQKRMKKYGKGL